jgi:hypothetical protein
MDMTALGRRCESKVWKQHEYGTAASEQKHLSHAFNAYQIVEPPCNRKSGQIVQGRYAGLPAKLPANCSERAHASNDRIRSITWDNSV